MYASNQAGASDVGPGNLYPEESAAGSKADGLATIVAGTRSFSKRCTAVTEGERWKRQIMEYPARQLATASKLIPW